MPTFLTKRLILRAVREEDAPSYHKHFVDYEVIRHLAAAVPWPYPESGVTDYLRDMILPKQGNDHWMWGIFLKSEPEELIGSVYLWREGKPENRGFWLGRKFWGKGIMTEAVRPVMDYAFNQLGFEKLIFTNAVGNLGSHRVKEKTGATLLKTEPAEFVDPKFTEHEIWELGKDNWKQKKSQEVIIRRASEGDGQCIHEAHMQSIQLVCSRDHSSEEIAAWGGRAFSKEKWIEAINHHFVWVVEIFGTIEGFAFLKIFKNDGITNGHIHGLYLTPAVLNMGIGRRLAELMLHEAEKSNVRELRLKSTITAHEFYKKLGFQDDGPQTTVEIAETPIRCFPMVKRM